jgi:hypothetical protein
MATFTASSNGSLKGTSIRSNPFSQVASALSGFAGQLETILGRSTAPGRVHAGHIGSTHDA